MGLLGKGKRAIIAQDNRVAGRVTGVKRCWWLKVNTKPVRAHALDGAVFPHIISFRYAVEGKEHQGRAYVPATARCPREGESIPVFVDGDDPARCAVQF